MFTDLLGDSLALELRLTILPPLPLSYI